MVSERLVLILVVLVVFSMASVPPAASLESKTPCEGVETNTAVEKSDISDRHLKYYFQFSEDSRTLCVKVENKGETETRSSFVTAVDGIAAGPEMPTLEPGESTFVTKNVTEYLNVNKNIHTVRVGVYPDFYNYNFTHELNASSPEVSSPYIRDVEVLRHAENDSTSLRVTTFNPGKRAYSMYVQVETFGTDGRYTIAAPQPNQTDVETIQLDESSDEVVAGKVRIFDEWAESSGKFDQKEFMAKPGEDTNAWDDHFEQVPGTIDEYTYSNESAERHRADYVDEDVLSPLEKQVGAALTVILLVGGLLWRRRRKFR